MSLVPVSKQEIDEALRGLRDTIRKGDRPTHYAFLARVSRRHDCFTAAQEYQQMIDSALETADYDVKIAGETLYRDWKRALESRIAEFSNKL